MKITKINQRDRINFLPKVIGRAFAKFEAMVYRSAEGMCDDYNGGYWEYYKTENGSLIMSPAGGEFKCSVYGNYYEGTLDAMAFGIACTLSALNTLIWAYHEVGNDQMQEKITNLYYQLWEAAEDHPQYLEIRKCLD